MQFAHPKMLWLLAATVLLLSLFFWWSWRRRQFLISQFVRSRLLAHLTVGLSKGVQKTRMVLLVLAVGCVLFALAQPQWGFAWEEARQRGLDIVVAIDTSRSMLAEDIAPNRLERAKLAALDLMRLAKRDRLGLVAFAGTAFLQCPLTLDDEAFRQSVNQLNAGIIPQGGTALAEAIETAQGAFREGDNHRVLVLFTDGEDHDNGAPAAAEKATAAGVRIFTVGVGTPAGELLRARDEQGNVGYVKDNEGNVVKSRLNETLLTQLATAGNGFYLPMTGAKTVDVLYQRGLEPLPRSETATKLIKQFKERFQWPLALAILLLLAELFLPERRRVARTASIVDAPNPELRKLVALLALSFMTGHLSASTSSALRKYEAGQFKDSYREYSRLLERRPDDVRLQYNAGAAAYQAKKFDDAVKHFSSATAAPDPKLQEQANYNLGNSLFRSGEEQSNPQEKIQRWEQSAKQFEAALKLDPKDEDAQANLELVRKKLEELKQQQQQQQDQKSDDQQKDQEKNQDQKQQDKSSPSDDKNKEGKSEKEEQKEQSQPKDEPKPGADKSKEQEKEKPGKSQQEKGRGDQEKEGSQSESGTKADGNSPTNSPEAANPVRPGSMTPEQVKQLLDAQKGNEKTMIFIPKDKVKGPKMIIKDW